MLVRYSLSPRLQISRRSKRFRAGQPLFGNSSFSLASEEPGNLTVQTNRYLFNCKNYQARGRLVRKIACFTEVMSVPSMMKTGHCQAFL